MMPPHPHLHRFHLFLLYLFLSLCLTNVVCQTSSSGVDSSTAGIGTGTNTNTTTPPTTSTSTTTPPTTPPTTTTTTPPTNIISAQQQYVINYRVYGDYNQLTTESRHSQLSTLVRLTASTRDYSHLFISIAARPVPTAETQRAAIEHWILINGKEMQVKNDFTSTSLKDAFIAAITTSSTINQRVNISFTPVDTPVNLTQCSDGKWHRDCVSSNTTPATSWSDSYALWTGILAVAGSSFAILGITFVLSYTDLSRGPRNVVDHDKMDIDELPVIASLTKATSSPSMRDTSTRVRIHKPALQAARWNDSGDEKSSESPKG